MASNRLAKIYAYILPRANSSALSNQVKCKNQELYIPSIYKLFYIFSTLRHVLGIFYTS